MSQGKARAFIQTKSAQAYDALMDEWEELQESNQRAMDDSFWGGLIGSIGLPLLATIGGPIGIGTAAALSGLGSYAGQRIGETSGGKLAPVQGGEAIEGQGFHSNKAREMRISADATDEAFDDQVLVNAINTAGSAYMMGGGAIPGTEGWTAQGGFTGAFDAAQAPAFGGFNLRDNVGYPLYSGGRQLLENAGMNFSRGGTSYVNAGNFGGSQSPWNQFGWWNN
tara:strand:+ start:1968 stop:2639 length:672 start_codon:yes stop_codon:yes gene_type:complete